MHPISTRATAPNVSKGGPQGVAAPEAEARLAPAQDQLAITDSRPYFDAAESRVTAALRAQGVSPERLSGKEIRGLSALLGKGLLSEAELTSLAERAQGDLGAVSKLLEARREAFMARVAADNKLPIEDGKGRWSVQELANVDYLLSQMPEAFMDEVRKGPALRRDGASDRYSGLYNPLTNRATLSDGFNVGDDASLEQVKEGEKRLRAIVLMEIGHAWQIRKSAPINPGIWGAVKGLLGVVWQKPDFISEWAQISGWTVQPKWSLLSLFGKRATPNLGTGSTNLKNLSFSLFGKKFEANLTDLKFDPKREGTMVSDYAKSDPYEDFGESLDAYFTDPEVLKRRSPEKYAYIRDKVMAGKEFDNRYGLYQ